MAWILLVDDEAAVCLVLAEALRDAGFTVSDALNAEEAWAALHACQVDALVTDINMGVRGWGFEFARAVRALQPDLPVVYITGDAEAAVSREGVPGSRVLPKPFFPHELVAVVRALLAAREVPADEGQPGRPRSDVNTG